MTQAPHSAFEMLALLRAVSRSFYVSIRLLPASLRRPVAVAYLLARATDTLADTAELPSVERREKLDTLAAAIDGRLAGRDRIASLAGSFARLQADAAERDLIIALPSCLSWLQELATPDRDDVRVVLRHITHGQALDIERFAPGRPAQALHSAEQLDQYTYLVAGCVGEFWTDLCFRHLPDFAALPRHEMRELGRGYGMGLQLVNILRDAGADLAAGRCYFPSAELAAAGLRPQDLLRQPERFEGVWQHWGMQAQRRLEAGMRYADAVRSRRVRAASAMPALIGARTLALLRSAGPRRLQHKVKVPRGQVRLIMARLAFTLAGRSALQSLFGHLGSAAWRGGWDNPGP